MKVGDQAEIAYKVTEKDVALFAVLSGDDNPIHLDDEYAKATPFGQRIVHGMFLGGLISSVLGRELPGPGAIYLHQTMSFKAPVYLNDTVRVVVKIVKVREDKPIVTFETNCYNDNGDIVLEGEAVLKVPADKV